MTKRALLAFAPILLLAACGDDDPAGEEPSEQGGEAAGEVLGGTISDDMLPLEELTSTSPLAERTGSESDTESDQSTEAESESDEAEAASSSAPAPAPATASTPTVAPPLDD